ncbi:MAG TPA: hypothetical protein VFT95_19990 [Micromonosporaceae bacterium]|nr:hypothetical protein [Micromonosporaceae bacterium]
MTNATRAAARAAALAALLALTSACGGGGDAPPPPGPSPTAASAADIVDLQGVRQMRFGETERDLTDRGLVVRDVPRCGPRMARPNGAGPVFVDGRLALVWADPPLRTPEGIGVGSGVSDVRQAYPAANALSAPAGSYRFGGLIATEGDRAYLFLHNGEEVQKLIVGYARHARTLFEQGYAGC